VNVAFGVFAFGLNVPVAPAVTIDQVPVAGLTGVFPPSPAVVPRAQMVCGPPTVDVGAARTVMVTSANESGHGGFEMVHLSTIVPGPLVGVNVAFGVLAFGAKVPVAPPVTIVQVPVPDVGVLPPSPAVALPLQIVCGPPTVAVGCCVTVINTSAVALWPQVGLVTVHLTVIRPGPLVGVNVAFGVLAFGLNVPVAPTVTIDQVPVSPAAGVFPPSPAVVPFSQTVCGPPTVATGAASSVIVTSAVASVHGAFDTVHLRTNGEVVPEV
jgi:hypothetical protein